MQLTEDRSHQAASYHRKYPELCKTNHSDSFWGPRWVKGFHSEDSHCLTPMCVGCVWDVMSWGQDPFPAALGMVGVVVGKGRRESSCHMVILGSGSKPGITNQGLRSLTESRNTNPHWGHVAAFGKGGKSYH